MLYILLTTGKKVHINAMLFSKKFILFFLSGFWVLQIVRIVCVHSLREEAVEKGILILLESGQLSPSAGSRASARMNGSQGDCTDTHQAKPSPPAILVLPACIG